MPERKYEHAPPRNKGETLTDYGARLGVVKDGVLKPSHIKQIAERKAVEAAEYAKKYPAKPKKEKKEKKVEVIEEHVSDEDWTPVE
tara:strand:+ start:5045 stop:5302 length:258 start_codon:yes stop_codon:yes gene_type:complete